MNRDNELLAEAYSKVHSNPPIINIVEMILTVNSPTAPAGLVQGSRSSQEFEVKVVFQESGDIDYYGADGKELDPDFPEFNDIQDFVSSLPFNE